MNHSKLKKRITMMYKSKSGAQGKMKALALVPMVALALGLASMPAVKAAVTTISNSEVSLNKGSENPNQTPHFKVISLNNSGIETTVVIQGEDMPNNVTVAGGTFDNNGNVHYAKSLNCSMTNNKATITAVFPFSENYNNSSVTLKVNGEDVKIDLDNFLKKSQTQTITISSQNGITFAGDIDRDSANDIDIMLDGKKISETKMKAINPETISSITVDKSNNQKKIIIISK